MSSPYPLQENDKYSYEFITDNGIKYKIYFLDYGFMFADYPSITCPVYFFNIEAANPNLTFSPVDLRIGETLNFIFKIFFANHSNVVVYVCDSMDGRQLKRKLRFDRWFFAYNDGSLLKQDGLAVIADTEIYNSIILHKNNPQLLDIIFAFKDLNEKAPEDK